MQTRAHMRTGTCTQRGVTPDACQQACYIQVICRTIRSETFGPSLSERTRCLLTASDDTRRYRRRRLRSWGIVYLGDFSTAMQCTGVRRVHCVHGVHVCVLPRYWKLQTRDHVRLSLSLPYTVELFVTGIVIQAARSHEF